MTNLDVKNTISFDGFKFDLFEEVPNIICQTTKDDILSAMEG